jgi:hypothetical protein
MPFALLIVGLALLVTAIRGTTSAFFTLVKGDFTGTGNFIYWIVAILVIGAVGYVKKLQPVSDMMLALVLIVLFLKSGTGFFDKFTQQIANPVAVNAPASSSSSTSAATGGVNGLLNGMLNINTPSNQSNGGTTGSGAVTPGQGPQNLGTLFGGSQNWSDITNTFDNFSGLFN